MKPTKCIYPKCHKEAHCRRLCEYHYKALYNLVKQKKITWEQAEEQGKCAPVGNSRWFLESKTWNPILQTQSESKQE